MKSPIAIIVREHYSGAKTLQEIFAEIIDAKFSQKNVWAQRKENDTIDAPTVKSKSVLFSNGGKNETTAV